MPLLSTNTGDDTSQTDIITGSLTGPMGIARNSHSKLEILEQWLISIIQRNTNRSNQYQITQQTGGAIIINLAKRVGIDNVKIEDQSNPWIVTTNPRVQRIQKRCLI